MKDGLSLRCVLQWWWISRVWTVIAIVHRKCCRVDVWACNVCIPSLLFSNSCGSRRIQQPMLSGFGRAHCAEKVVVKCSFCLGWEINRCVLKEFPSLSVFSAEPWTSKGEFGVSLSTRSHSQYCAMTWVSAHKVTRRCTDVEQVSFLCVLRFFLLRVLRELQLQCAFWKWSFCCFLGWLWLLFCDFFFWSRTCECGVLVLLGKAASLNGVALQSIGRKSTQSV